MALELQKVEKYVSKKIEKINNFSEKLYILNGYYSNKATFWSYYYCFALKEKSFF